MLFSLGTTIKNLHDALQLSWQDSNGKGYILML